jgi:hypothetical protein
MSLLLLLRLIHSHLLPRSLTFLSDGTRSLLIFQHSHSGLIDASNPWWMPETFCYFYPATTW